MSRYFDFVDAHFVIYRTSGDECLVQCCFHDDNNPSMGINVAKGKFRCYSCGEAGDISRIADALNVHLVDRGISTHSLRKRLNKMQDHEQDKTRIRPDEWLDRFDFEHDEWTEGRGFSKEIIERFDLGYCHRSDRLTIPIRNRGGELLGVIYRRLDNEKPKYLYPKNFAIGKSLFGSWLVYDSDLTKVALTEGPLDAVACWDARVPALGLLGAQLTKDQRRLLLSLGVRTVVIMTDRDRAGIRAVRQIKNRLYKSGITVKVGEYRSYWIGKDPGELEPIQRRKMFHSSVMYRVWYENNKKWLFGDADIG